MPNLAHIFAFYKKEFISAKRNLFCTIFSICIPWTLMFLNWYIITKFPSTKNPELNSEITNSFSVAIDPNIEAYDILGMPNQLLMLSSFYNKSELNLMGIIKNDLTITQKMIDLLENSNIGVIKFDNEEEMVKYGKLPNRFVNDTTIPQNLTGGIEFIKDGSVDGEFKYKIYVNQFVINDIGSNYISQLEAVPQIQKVQHFSQVGVFSLKTLADTLILQNITNNPNASIKYVFVPMEAGASSSSVGGLVNKFFVPLIFVASGLLIYRELALRLLDDKSSRMRETMSMMGMSDSSYFLGAFLFYLTEVLITTIVSTVIICVGIFNNINLLLMFLFLVLFNLTFFPYALCITAIFSKRFTAMISGVLTYYVSFIVVFTISIDFLSSRTQKLIYSLIPSMAFTNGLSVISSCMTDNIYLGFNNLSLFQSYGFSLDFSFYFFIIDFSLLLLLGLYLDNVIPNLGGISRGFLFFLDKSYWCGSKKIKKEIIEEKRNLTFNESIEEASENIKNQSQEKIIKIRNLKKVFGDDLIAVDNLSLEIYSDQIFALLGHNGAGKTTTISILCGLLSASGGSVEMLGFDLFSEITQIRKRLGLCPQNDILFEYLTVEEHLDVFGTFKGLTKSQIKSETDLLLKELALRDKKYSLAINLSGGQKRKLSIAIACIGRPDILILDEPTAGLDASSRHELWEILKKFKSDRIVILTTHYMDEADVLGDRVAIISEGKLSCLGSSLFLKNKFGIGYNLAISKLEGSDKIKELIKSLSINFSNVSESDVEIIFKLPFSETGKFNILFDKIEHDKVQLGIKAYSLTMTTLEDVFLKIGIDSDKAKKLIKNESLEVVTHNFSQDSFSIANNCKKSFLKEVFAIWYKKIIEFKRYPANFFFHIFIPLGLIFISIYASSEGQSTRTHYYELSDLPLPQRPVISNETFNGTPYQELIELLAQDFKLNIYKINHSQGDKGFREYIKNYQKIATDVSNQEPLEPYRYGGFSLLDYNSTSNEYTAIILYNMSNVQTSFSFSNMLFNKIIKNMTSKNMFVTAGLSQIVLIYDKLLGALYTSFQRMSNCPMYAIAFAFTPAFLCMYFAKENIDELKHQQFISGMTPFIYWLSNFAIDLLVMYVAIGLSLLLSYNYRRNVADYTWLFLLLLPPSIILFSYISCFFFDRDNRGFIAHMILHPLVSANLPVLPFILRINYPGTIWYYITTILISIIPSGAVTCGLYSICFIPVYNIYEKKLEDSFQPLDYSIGGIPLIMLIFDIFFYIGILIFQEKFLPVIKQNIQSKIGMPRIMDNEIKEKEVMEIENEVINDRQNKMAIKAQEISRTFEEVIAVNNLTFGVNYGEIMALLGINGAGKTTTFRMMTDVLASNSGSIYLNGHSLASNEYKSNKQMIGYCPQISPLFEYLTVYEHLKFYSNIKGIPDEYIEKHVSEMIKSMELKDYKNKMAATLSGGNKRKLAVSLSLIGNPPILIMDEPSTGIDPKARRQMWQIIRSISMYRKQCGVLLSTHSMEEAENLGTVIGILIKGGILKCYGTPTQIKDKYGTAYIVEIKLNLLSNEDINNYLSSVNINENLKISREDVPELLNKVGEPNLIHEIDEKGIGKFIDIQIKIDKYTFSQEIAKLILSEKYLKDAYEAIKNIFGSVEIIDYHLNYKKLKIERGNFHIGKIFQSLEDIKNMYKIKEYSVIPTTLEEIFEIFAKEGREKGAGREDDI